MGNVLFILLTGPGLAYLIMLSYLEVIANKELGTKHLWVHRTAGVYALIAFLVLLLAFVLDSMISRLWAVPFTLLAFILALSMRFFNAPPPVGGHRPNRKFMALMAADAVLLNILGVAVALRL